MRQVRGRSVGEPSSLFGLARLSQVHCGVNRWTYNCLRVADLVAWGDNVFYTDGLGTGKSTVLRAIVRELHEQGQRVRIVTPTGISALNLGGSTYFAWAGWSPRVTKESIDGIETMAMTKERRRRIKETDVLIIDEISMLESNKFRRLDRACRVARQCDRPFGGVQIVIMATFTSCHRSSHSTHASTAVPS